MKALHRFSVSTVALLVGLGTMPALAQEAITNTQSSDAGNVVQGDVSAENGIEQGLKSGQLSPEEAARLEAHQAKVDQIESRDLRDGQLSTNEQNRIDNAELKEGSRIVALDNNGVTADPDSKSSTRMANDVQRDANQENRILNNTNNGNLTDTQIGALERGQARVDGMEAKDGSNNVVDYSEQNRIRTAENGQSTNIHDDAHDNVTVQGSGTNNDSNRDWNNRGWDKDGDHMITGQSSPNNTMTTNTNTNVSGSLNGQSVTADNASVSTAGTTGVSSGMNTAVTTPHMTPHPITHMGHH